MNVNVNVNNTITKINSVGKHKVDNVANDATIKKSVKTDILSLSDADASFFNENVSYVKRAADQISQPTSTDKLESLKASIANGDYFISSDSIANSILGDF